MLPSTSITPFYKGLGQICISYDSTIPRSPGPRCGGLLWSAEVLSPPPPCPVPQLGLAGGEASRRLEGRTPGRWRCLLRLLLQALGHLLCPPRAALFQALGTVPTLRPPRPRPANSSPLLPAPVPPRVSLRLLPLWYKALMKAS